MVDAVLGGQALFRLCQVSLFAALTGSGCRSSALLALLRTGLASPCAVQRRAFWARGALCMAVSTLIMCTSALCVKLIGNRVPLFEIVVRRPSRLRAI